MRGVYHRAGQRPDPVAYCALQGRATPQNQIVVASGPRPRAASCGFSISCQTLFLVKYKRPVKTMRKMITWKPMRLRASSVGSAAHIKKAAMSLAYWSTVCGAPSVYVTTPSDKGGGIPMACPGKYMLYWMPAGMVMSAGLGP